MKIREKIGELEVELDLGAILKVVAAVIRKAGVKVQPFEVLALALGIAKSIFKDYFYNDMGAYIRSLIAQGLTVNAAEEIVRAVLTWIAYKDLDVKNKLFVAFDEVMREDPCLKQLLERAVTISGQPVSSLLLVLAQQGET